MARWALVIMVLTVGRLSLALALAPAESDSTNVFSPKRMSTATIIRVVDNCVAESPVAVEKAKSKAEAWTYCTCMVDSLYAGYKPGAALASSICLNHAIRTAPKAPPAPAEAAESDDET